MKRLLYIILFIPFVVFAQDPVFVQPYSAPIYLNPAFAGYEGCSRIASSYVNHYPALGSTFITGICSYDQYVKQLHGGFAIRYMFDSQADGAYTLNTAYIAYSPYFRLFDKKLLISPAIEIGWRRNHINEWYYIYPSPPPLYGPFFGPYYEIPDENTFHMLDINCGILISHKKFVYGFAVHHLTEPPMDWRQASDAVLSRKYTMHFSYLFDIKEKHKLSPSLLFMQQKDYQTFNAALAYSYSYFRAAIGANKNFKFHFDEFIFNAGYHQRWLTIGYGYRLTISRLKNHRTLGAHEISFSATFNCKNKEENRKGPELINF